MFRPKLPDFKRTDNFVQVIPRLIPYVVTIGRAIWGGIITGVLAAEIYFASEQDKKLTDGEIKKLKDAGYDPHKLKGKNNASKKDLYKKPNGDIVVKPKGGAGEGDPTGININDL